MINSSSVRSLAFQISAVIIITLSSASIAFAMWFSYSLTESNRTLKIGETIALGKSLGSSVLHSLTNDDYVAIEQLLLKTQDFTNVKQISVINSEHLVISEVARNMAGVFKVTFRVAKEEVPAITQVKVVELDESDLVWIPMQLGTRMLGWIKIQIDTHFLHRLYQQHLLTMSMATLAILSISLVAIFVFLRPRLKSLALTTEFADSLANNYGKTMAEQLGSHELDALARALNTTSLQLLNQDKQLREKQNLLLVTNNNLQERIKELNGIYSMSRILNNPTENMHSKLQQVVDVLPLAWQFPSIACCRIIYLDTSFVSKPFCTSHYFLHQDILIDNKTVGSVSIYYTDNPGEYDDGPFLKEEVFLLQEIALGLGNYLKQYQTQRELEKVNETLELRVKQRTQELESAIALAEKANNAKTEFLSRVSHELRTPMNAVIGFSTLLKMDRNTPLSEKQQGNVQHILDASEHLMILINEILDISHIEKGNIDLHSESVCSSEIVAELIPLFTPMAAEKNITVELHSTTAALPNVMLDIARFKQIMINLLSNAIKYNSPNGRVDIYVEAKSDKSQEIRIVDTGIGISEDDIPLIFEPFKRLKAAEQQEGYGIGLAVVKMLVELMHGSITVKSGSGKGSEFILSFPLA